MNLTIRLAPYLLAIYFRRIFIAIKQWLKDRLSLEISEEKSKVVNLKKHYSEFLGFKIKAVRKGDKFVVRSHMSDKAVKRETKRRDYAPLSSALCRILNTAVRQYNRCFQHSLYYTYQLFVPYSQVRPDLWEYRQ